MRDWTLYTYGASIVKLRWIGSRGYIAGGRYWWGETSARSDDTDEEHKWERATGHTDLAWCRATTTLISRLAQLSFPAQDNQPNKTPDSPCLLLEEALPSMPCRRNFNYILLQSCTRIVFAEVFYSFYSNYQIPILESVLFSFPHHLTHSHLAGRLPFGLVLSSNAALISVARREGPLA